MIWLGLVVGGVLTGAAAVAAPESIPGTAAFVKPGQKVCTIKDERLVELSGLVATSDGFIVVNDSTDVASRKKIFFLDQSCRVEKEVDFPSSPLDPEDLALSPDGATLFVADIGDNPTNKDRRATVALWTMPVDGSAKPVIHRLTYPDGPHDAEALLFKSDGTPIIVTKEPGRSGLYAPTGPLQPNTREGVPMAKLGEVKIPETQTSHAVLGAVARKLVTGGATAAGGSRVVLRTYADAFEWDVPDGDVVAALTNGIPRVTPLPDEPLGEAISYTPDGKQFVTVSETAELDGVEPTILAYVPGTEPVQPTGDRQVDDERAGPSLLDRLGLEGLQYLVGAVGVLGAGMVGAGVYGILRARRRPTPASEEEGPTDQPVKARSAVPARVPQSGEPAYETTGWGSERKTPRGSVYGRPGARTGGEYPGGEPAGGGYGAAARPPAGGHDGRRSGAVYGAPPREGPAYGDGHPGGRGGTVYGGRGYDDGWSAGGADRGPGGSGDHPGYHGGYGYR
ncbi:MAG TPA: hypothetical protein VF174_01475 [Micromonosporaceae bacterium]